MITAKNSTGKFTTVVSKYLKVFKKVFKNTNDETNNDKKLTKYD